VPWTDPGGAACCCANCPPLRDPLFSEETLFPLTSSEFASFYAGGTFTYGATVSGEASWLITNTNETNSVQAEGSVSKSLVFTNSCGLVSQDSVFNLNLDVAQSYGSGEAFGTMVVDFSYRIQNDEDTYGMVLFIRTQMNVTAAGSENGNPPVNGFVMLAGPNFPSGSGDVDVTENISIPIGGPYSLLDNGYMGWIEPNASLISASGSAELSIAFSPSAP